MTTTTYRMYDRKPAAQKVLPFMGHANFRAVFDILEQDPKLSYDDAEAASATLYANGRRGIEMRRHLIDDRRFDKDATEKYAAGIKKKVEPLGGKVAVESCKSANWMPAIIVTFDAATDEEFERIKTTIEERYEPL